MIAADIALAFNTVNERKAWTARPNSRSDTGIETVHFNTPNNLVTLVYECDPGRFVVRFNKVHATWGDYVRAIARSLHIVLSTLKAAGLPFDAPPDTDGIEIIVTATNDNTVYVRWPGHGSVANPAMPLASFDGVTPLCIETAIMPEIRTPEAIEAVEEAAPTWPADKLGDPI